MAEAIPIPFRISKILYDVEKSLAKLSIFIQIYFIS